jgi:hypothetical protein
MGHTSTHSYAMLAISPAAYREIREKLLAAGYGDQFHERNGAAWIDMHGIAIKMHCPACADTRVMPGDPTASADSILRHDVPCPECST